MNRWMLVLAWTLILSLAQAKALVWQTMRREIQADAGQASIMLTFAFKNGSGQRVLITSALPSCDCLTLKLEKRSYAPGETGELHTEFSLGGRMGRQEKTVTVTTDDAPDSPTVLTLVVNIPEPVAIYPKFLFWRVGEAAAEKVIEITLANPDKSSVEEAQCAEPTFAVRLETGQEPGWHRILIRPTDTAKPVQAPVRLTATVNGHPKVFVVVAAVK